MYDNNLNHGMYDNRGAGSVRSELRPYNLAPPQQWVPASIALKGRPVSSIDEAKASQIDFDGSVYFFPDVPNKKIYTKTINMDGTASFNVYVLDETGQAAAASSYVTHAELEELLSKLSSNQTPAAAAPKFNL